MASDPNAEMFSGVNAVTILENIKLGKPIFWDDQLSPFAVFHLESEKQKLTRLSVLTPFADAGGKSPFLVTTNPMDIQMSILSVGAKAIIDQD
jgi:hypothetical protein